MTVDMQMLIATAVLAFLQPLPYLFAYLSHWGPKVAFGNRDNVPALPAWADRALRAHRNTTENLVHFAAVVLAVNYLGLSNEATALGASIFFWSRLGFVITYIAGIVWVRSAIFIAGLFGEGIIVFQLLINGF